jgi:very-short-patch-repair endonuclease
MLGGVLNERVGRHTIDVALLLGSTRVAVEYDSWYWHGNKKSYDRRKHKFLVNAGWKLLRIRSERELPTKEKLLALLDRLARSGRCTATVTLPDWGKGPFFGGRVAPIG